MSIYQSTNYSTQKTGKIEKLQDWLRISLDAFESSRLERREIQDLYHNRHYTAGQLSILRQRKQPAETFNIIKSYTRMMTGYLSTVVASIMVKSSNIDKTAQAAIGQDVMDYTLKDNNFLRLRSRLEKDLILNGLLCFRVRGIKTGKKDMFGTDITKVEVKRIPGDEIVTDPMASEDDYSDGRWIHRWKWVPEEELVKLYGKAKVKKLYADQNTENIGGYDLTAKFNGSFVGRYHYYHNYLVIETQYKDTKGNIKYCIWSHNTILEEGDLSHLERFEYRPIFLEESENAEVYGVMRELKETQHAINQALIQIQLLVNTNKVYVQEGAVEDFEVFKQQFARVNSMMKVLDINGIKIENLNSDIVAQYQIIDAALDRCQKITGMNDAFLGISGSSASGRQVKLQQNSAVVALRYLTDTIEFAYREMGESILQTAKVYFKANDYLRLTDEQTGDRWTEINKPLTAPNMQGQEEVVYYDEFEYDEETNEVRLIPVIDPDTSLEDLEWELDISTAVYQDTDDVERLTLEAILAGPAGQTLRAVSPGDYLEISGMHVQALKGRNSDKISQIFYRNAKKLTGAPTMDPRQVEQQGGGMNGTNGQSSSPQKLLSAMGATNDQKPAGYNQGA